MDKITKLSGCDAVTFDGNTLTITVSAENIDKIQRVVVDSKLRYKTFYEDVEWIPVSKRLPKQSGKYIVTLLRWGVSDRERKHTPTREVDYVPYDAARKQWSRAKFLKIIAPHSRDFSRKLGARKREHDRSVFSV